MNEPSKEFCQAMDKAFGKHVWNFDNFSYDGVYFIAINQINYDLLKNKEIKHLKSLNLDDDDVVSYHNGEHDFEPLNEKELKKIKSAILEIAKV